LATFGHEAGEHSISTKVISSGRKSRREKATIGDRLNTCEWEWGMLEHSVTQ